MDPKSWAWLCLQHIKQASDSPPDEKSHELLFLLTNTYTHYTESAHYDSLKHDSPVAIPHSFVILAPALARHGPFQTLPRRLLNICHPPSQTCDNTSA